MIRRHLAPPKKWEDKFEELEVYKCKHGNCNNPQKEGQLGRWVKSRRQANKKGQEGQVADWNERKQKLTELGFKW